MAQAVSCFCRSSMKQRAEARFLLPGCPHGSDARSFRDSSWLEELDEHAMAPIGTHVHINHVLNTVHIRSKPPRTTILYTLPDMTQGKRGGGGRSPHPGFPPPLEGVLHPHLQLCVSMHARDHVRRMVARVCLGAVMTAWH